MTSKQSCEDVLRLVKQQSELCSRIVGEGRYGSKPESAEFYYFPRHLMRDIEEALARPPAETSAAPAYVSVGHQFRFPSQFPGGGHVWRSRSDDYNGSRYDRSREIFALKEPAEETSSPLTARQQLNNLLDAACENLMETPDEEILAEAKEDGDDPAAIRERALQRVGVAVDAVRYRWLRAHFRFASDSLQELWFDPSISEAPSAELDAAIDRASKNGDEQ